MENVDLDIKKILNRIKRRLFVAQLINYLIICIIIGVSIGVGIVILSRFIPIYKPYRLSGILVGIAALISVIWCFIKMPKDITTALKADSLGLKERITTSLELKGNEEIMARLQKKDALKHIRKLDYKRELTLVPNKKFLISLLILVCIFSGLSFVPNDLNEVAIKNHQLKIDKKTAFKEVEKIEKKVEENKNIDEIKKAELLNNLSELKKQVKESENKESIDKNLEKSSKKLELLKKELLNDDLKKVSETFMKNELTKEIGKMLKEKNQEKLSEELKKVSEKLKDVSQEELSELAKNLNELSKELSNNPELAESIASLASKLAEGDAGASSEALSEMSGSISELMENAEFAEALNNVAQALNSQTQGENNGNSQEQGSGEGNGEGNGTGKGQGQGNGSGGQGTGTGGGAGSGSDKGNEESPEGSNSGGLSNKDGNNGENVNDYDKIFSPTSMDSQGETSILTGQKNDDGNSQQIITEKGVGIKGNSVPYNQVMGQYKNKAYENMENSYIPDSMKNLVKDYFSSLED